MLTATAITLAVMTATAALAVDTRNDTVPQPADCGIACHPWYTFCLSRPYNYRCDNQGRFKRGHRLEGCERVCFCRCDALDEKEARDDKVIEIDVTWE